MNYSIRLNSNPIILIVIISIINSLQIGYVKSGRISLNSATIPNLVSRLGESILLPCGENEHDLLKELEANEPGMPVLVNWFKHYSLKRRSDKPIYAKYLANNIDYAPHISKDYESRLQVVDKINLNISDLQATDEALYECRLVLFDKAYTDSQTGSMFYLQVYVAPEFEFPNEEIVYFNPNVPIRLYCYAKGKPNPTITWYKNGEKLKANTSVLQEYTSPHDSDNMLEYRCEAENQIGKIQHTVKVIPSGSLFFTQPLRNLTITEGTILNWPCLAQSDSDVTYKWFRDSVSVQLGLHKWSDRGALFQDGMLYLLETFRNDSGYFECHAFTNNKRIETKAYLNIQYGPEIESFQSPYYVVENSESIVIDCVVNSNPQITSLEWFKDKYLLSNTNKYQILKNNSLLIKNIQKADRGNYYCSCNNTIKKAVSTVINIEIINSKKIKSSNLYADDYKLFRIPCEQYEVDSGPIEWFKLNSQLPKNRYVIDQNDGSLNIKHLKLEDTGVYFCKRTNGHVTTKDLENAINLSINFNDDNFYSTNEIKTTKHVTEAKLPGTPSGIMIDEVDEGVYIKWSHPIKNAVEIDHYQIYYRKLGSNSAWKTTEPISSNEHSFFIDGTTFNVKEETTYELKIISFSSFSKSLPSSEIRFKYSPRKDSTSLAYDVYSTKSYSELGINKDRFSNLSRLDMILILIFLTMIVILLVCIIGCVAYRKTSRERKKMKQSLKNDFDDWGFQSAATATFLSSASSSEKSFNIFNKYSKKSKYNSATDSDVVTKIVDCPQEDDNLYNNLYSNFKIQKASEQKLTKTLSQNDEHMKSRYSPSNPIEQLKISNHSPNSMNGIGNTSSSGIHSCDESNSDESIQHVPIRKDGFLTVNTIKYNAKTNMIQHPKFSANSLKNAKKNKNVICEESEETDQSTCLFENQKNSYDSKYTNSPKSEDYYQWMNENTASNSDSVASGTYSPSSFTPTLLNNSGLQKYAKSTSSTSSSDSNQNSPPFPVLNKHIINYGSSLTMVSTRLPHSNECSSSNASTSSGCSSYESKTMRPLSRLGRQSIDSKRASGGQELLKKDNFDYENLKYLHNAIEVSSKTDQFAIYRSNNALGTFKSNKYDYV